MENWGKLSHLFVTVFLSSFADLMITPALPDVTLAAVCPGQDECSIAIYLNAVQQAVTGLGSVFMMPVLGNLSDIYGRKIMLTIPMFFSIIPSVLLALTRTKNSLYAYYVIRTLTGMVTQGGVIGISLAYLADTVTVDKRVSAFGILSGVLYTAYVGGTFASRVLSTSQIFQVTAGISIVAIIYMGLFLEDTTRHTDPLEQPILKITECDESTSKAPRKVHLVKNIPSPTDVLALLKSSTTFPLLAIASFFYSLADAGVQVCLLYYLKAYLHYQKDEMADLLLVAYIGATISNMVFMPTLGPLIGEETILCLGFLAGLLNMFFDSIAWAPWVPLAAASTGFFAFLAPPAVRSLVSKQVGPNEQGLAQGCILGLTALANVVSPLIYSPLTALSLSEKAPFRFQGFAVLCVAVAWLAGFFVSIVIKVIPYFSRNGTRTGTALSPRSV